MLAYNLLDFVSNPKPENLFQYLPQEITIDILLRLPVSTIMKCKFVCKSWLNLIKCSEFAMTHHSKSPSSGLALIEDSSKPYKIFDEVGVHGCAIISNFSLPTHCWRPGTTRLSSDDGLLLLFDECTSSPNLFICNPITREYIELSPPGQYPSCWDKFGFGASKVTGQYKVVLLFTKPHYECKVYTLGTGLWRSIAARRYGGPRSVGGSAALLNGNLHWWEHTLISCFDLETKQFTSFSLPRRHRGGIYLVSVLEGRLCLFNTASYDSKFVIWSMNKYGDENSWAQKFVTNTTCLYYNSPFMCFYAIKVFQDSGDILLGLHRCERLFFFSKKSKSFEEYGHLQVCRSDSSKVVNYTPSFLSLKTMGFQNVASF